MKKIISLILAFLIMMSCICISVSASGDYRTWLQSDGRWGSISFGNVGDTIAKSGCAITSIAKLMVHTQAVPDDTSQFNPGIFCTFLKQRGGFTENGWLYWAKVNDYTSSFRYVDVYSVEGKSAGEKTEKIKSYIDSGYAVVVAVKYSGHYVAVDKVENGIVYIMDPASNDRTRLFDSYDNAGVMTLRIFKGPTNGQASSPNPPTPSDNYTVGKEGSGVYRITSSDGLNIRSGAGTEYQKVGAVGYGQEVTVTEVSGDWGHISSGWICLRSNSKPYAEIIKPNLYAISVASTPQKTVYKSGESLDTSGLSITLKFTDGSTKNKDSDFTVSALPASSGVHSITVDFMGLKTQFNVTVEDVNNYQTGKYIVNSSNGINVRAGVGTTTDIVGALTDQTEIYVTEVQGNWGKISHEGLNGWICLDYTVYKPDIPKGDANKDGKVSTADALLILQYSVGKNIPSECSVDNCDLNNDGKISTADALLALQISVGKK